MSREPLTIWQCPECGKPRGDYQGRKCQHFDPDERWIDMVEVRVFREEDVRPLWEALYSARHALHRACLMIGSTEGFREDFQAINDAVGRERNDG